MKILHTSDLHIGHTLRERSRRDETATMLQWILEILRTEEVDGLLIAGDIFDRSNPGNEAQQMYYQFLSDVRLKTPCKHVVVIAGNHDSPSLIDAPKELAQALNIFVVGTPALKLEDMGRQITILREGNEKNGRPKMIVCAIPYISEAALRSFRINLENASKLAHRENINNENDCVLNLINNIENRDQRAAAGMAEYYRRMTELALKTRMDLGDEGKYIPIVAMGHLATIHCELGGGEENGAFVREELEKTEHQSHVIGTLLAFEPADIFSDSLAYVALGHIHKAQKVARRENWRFSGSPMHLDFGETAPPSVAIVDFQGPDAKNVTVRTIPAPIFRHLTSIKGNLDDIFEALKRLKSEKKDGETVWCSVTQTLGEPTPDLRAQVEAFVEGCGIDILLARSEVGRTGFQGLVPEIEGEDLRDLIPEDVFKRLLISKGYHEESEQFADLVKTFKEAVSEMDEVVQ